MSHILEFLDRQAPDLNALALKVWESAELGFKEHESSEALAAYLERNGFDVTRGAGGIPTAFVAQWGTGHPHIGFLGEFDALGGLSQEAVPFRKPRVEGAPGHGCGHNLLGAASAGAAVALKESLTKEGLSGTIRYYGCPAEEILAGKVYMAREGLFSDLDAAITWHPGSMTTVRLGSGTAMNSAKFAFHGKTAHAAGDPHNGRSALDAVELMNVGSNYLREHVIPSARLHYVITYGGDQPNVVPAEAEVWYFVRAPERAQVEEIFERLVDVAKGASLMTGTTYDVNLLTGCYGVLLNETLADVMWSCLQQVGPPVFDEGDREFAEKLRESFDNKGGLPKDVLSTELIEPQGKGRAGGGSTDVGDVSWIVPTVQMSAASVPLGCPGHSWQYCASAGSSIGQKGMLVAAKTMALCGLSLVRDPEVLEKAKAEFDAKTKDTPYKCPFPEGVPFPLDEFFK